MIDLKEAKENIGQGRPWNPYKGGFVPFLKLSPVERLKWQRDRAAHFLAREIGKMAPATYLQPVPARVKLLKKCMRMAERRLKDYIRLKRIITRCELKPMSAAMARQFEGLKLPQEVVVLYYNGGGVVGLRHGRIQSEMVLAKTVWRMRRADSEIQFVTRIYGDLVCHLG